MIDKLFKKETKKTFVRESDTIFRKAYEERSISVERSVNKVRYAFFVLFLLTGISSYFQGSPKPVYLSIISLSFVSLTNTIFWHILLARSGYSSYYKYISTGIDVTLVFFLKFGFHYDPILGWAMALKEPASFDVFFLFIVLAGLRLDKTFSWFVGIYSVFLYSLLIFLAMFMGDMSFSGDPAKFLDPNSIRFTTEFSKMMFLLACTAVIAYLSNDTRLFLTRLAESESMTKHNVNIMQDSMNYVESVSDRLNDTMKELSENSKTMKENIRSMDQSSKQDVEEVKKIFTESSSVNEITNAMVQLLDKIVSRISRLKETTLSTEKGALDSLNKAIESKNSLEESQTFLSQTVEVVKEMKGQSEKIMNISGTINEISDQTNLLSLNASIEAARAGEHGKGFSVVAQEVQKLADKSLKSSKEINKIIIETVKNIDKTSTMIQSASSQLQIVENISNTENEFLQELLEQIKKQVKTNDVIQSDINNIREISGDISTLVENQKESMGYLNNRIEDRQKLTLESSNIFEKLHEIAGILEQILKDLNTVIKNKDKIVQKDKRYP